MLIYGKGKVVLAESTVTKVLGLNFHSTHSWLLHIKIIKTKAPRAFILKFLAHPSKGCSRKVLLPLYQFLLRSIFDFVSPIYGLASPSNLRLLDPIQNSALRITMGAFRASPAISLCVELEIPPLHFRRLELTGKFLATAFSYPSLPIHQFSSQ